MKLDVDEILGRVAQTEQELGDWYKLAREWDLMWQLNDGSGRSWKQTVEEDGREKVVLNTPFTVVNLAQRLIATEPHITVPPKSQTNDDANLANRVERWLTGAWWQANRNAGRNLFLDLSWQMLVRGAAVLDVRWVADDLPEKLRKRRFPINIRTLDPMNVGVKRGPLFTEWAYHKYESDVVSARQRYPNIKQLKPEKNDTQHRERERVKIVDFWWTDPKSGQVWNAVLVDQEFGMKPRRMDYPLIPILEGYGDSAPSANLAYQRLSILHAINGLWQYQNRLASNMATGVLWYTWPHFMVETPQGHEMQDIEVRPGATDNVVEGTKITPTLAPFNLGGLQQMFDQIENQVQNATFPRVMYGDAGNMQAGYGVTALQASARNRTQGPREYLEMMTQEANELMLSLVEEFGDDEGVELYAMDTKRKAPYIEKITPEEIDGYYRNLVNLEPNVPQDDVGKETMLVRLADGKYISRKTLRDNTTMISIPPDENDRVQAEMLEENPEIMKRVQLASLMETRPNEWEWLIKGTEFEQLARDLGLLEEEPVPPGHHRMPDGSIMPDAAMMPPGGLQGAPMGLEGPGGPPMPPGGAPIQPPMEMIPPQGGGIPPVLQGQLEAEMLGLPPGTDPLLLQQLLGQQIPPGEELDLLAGR